MGKKERRELRNIEPEGRWLSPFEEMERRFEDMENWVEGIFGHPLGRPIHRHAWSRFPRFRESQLSVDVFEEKNDLVIKAEVPGIEKGDLDIKISENVITISGEKKREEKVEEEDYYFHERASGSFRRQIPLPQGTDAEKAKATFQDGVLEIRMPKTEEAKEKVKNVPIL
ncbi:MAG: Hsp20/alpha crystallin family protein [Deltaproteobacteria bacterium]|nr:Hsp20/alpha crystallin family protein [Deltaproteobacteria bacterium]